MASLWAGSSLSHILKRRGAKGSSGKESGEDSPRQYSSYEFTARFHARMCLCPNACLCSNAWACSQAIVWLAFVPNIITLWLANSRAFSCIMPTGRLQACKNQANSHVPVINSLLAWNLLHRKVSDWDLSRMIEQVNRKERKETALWYPLFLLLFPLLRMCMWKKW